MDSRKRPLQTCAISLLEIANKLYTSAILKNFNGRVDPSLASSLWIIYSLRCQLLAILAFVDDWILSLESLAETIFPPLTKLFDRIDGVVQEAEGLPPKLDGCIEKLSDLVRQVPLLDRVLIYSVSLVEFLLYVLHQWGGLKKEEVDVACKSEKQKFEQAYGHQELNTNSNKWENVQKNDHPSSGTWSSTNVSETDDTATDSDCSGTKSGRENTVQFLKEAEDSSESGWGKAVKGSYEDLLEKADREEEMMKNKGRRQSRNNKNKGSKGVHQEEITREVALLKGRRKGKRKKMRMDNK